MPIVINGQRRWQEFEDIKPEDNDFNEIGTSFENEYPDKIIISRVGEAQARMFRQRDIVDYAISWMSKYRNN